MSITNPGSNPGISALQFYIMKPKALHDFANNDYRILGKLLVRLNFVRTWSARRTLAYYKTIRSLLAPMIERMYDGEYLPDLSKPMEPSTAYMYPGLKPGTMVQPVKYALVLKSNYSGPEDAQLVSDVEELMRYKAALHWILGKKEDVPYQPKKIQKGPHWITKHGKLKPW